MMLLKGPSEIAFVMVTGGPAWREQQVFACEQRFN